MDENILRQLNELLVPLAAKVQGFELTNMLSEPAERAWMMRGLGDDGKLGREVEVFAPTPSEAYRLLLVKLEELAAEKAQVVTAPAA